MSKKRFVDNVRVNDPCSESWDEMTGNDRVRSCSHCSKSVSNLSSITRKEADRLVRNSKGSICVRYLVDPVTLAPVFADQFVRITRRASGLAAGVMSASFALSNAGYAQGGLRIPTTNDTEPGIAQTNNQKPQAADTGRTHLSGTITDEAGAVIPGAEVTLVPTTGGQKRSVITDSIGVYSFADVLPGEYALEITSSGFSENSTRLGIAGQVAMIEDRTLEVRYAGIGGVMVMTRRYAPLAQAVYDDDLEAATELLARGEDVNGIDKEYDSITPLFVAVQSGNLRMATLLLEWGADVNTLDEQKQTALMQLDEDSSQAMVTLLVKYGAELDLADEDGDTALMLAAQNAEADVVMALIDAGADVRIKNREGKNALMNAAYDDDLEKVRILLLAGAAIDINDKDDEGETAWDKTSEDEIEALLVSYGAIATVEIEEPAVDDDPR